MCTVNTHLAQNVEAARGKRALTLDELKKIEEDIEDNSSPNDNSIDGNIEGEEKLCKGMKVSLLISEEVSMFWKMPHAPWINSSSQHFILPAHIKKGLELMTFSKKRRTPLPPLMALLTTHFFYLAIESYI